LKLVLKILALFGVVFFLAEVVLSLLGFRDETELLFSIEPKSLFQAHDVFLYS